MAPETTVFTGLSIIHGQGHRKRTFLWESSLLSSLELNEETNRQDWRCSSVLEHLPSKGEALGSILYNCQEEKQTKQWSRAEIHRSFLPFY